MKLKLKDRAALPACLLALAFAGCSKELALPRIEEDDIRFELGIAGVLERSAWNLLQLKVRNLGADFQGALEVQGLVESSGSATLVPEQLVYHEEVEVPGKSGTFRVIAFPVRPEGWREVLLSFKSPRYQKTFRFHLSPPEPPPRARVLVIGGEGQDLKPLLDPASWDIPENKVETAEPGKKPSIALATISASELPVFPRAYDPFHAVLLHGASLAEASPLALEALAAWVDGGGTLLAIPGPGWASGVPEALWKLLGVSSGDPGAVLPPELSRRFEKTGAKAFYRELGPLPGTREVEGGLAFVSSPGAGRVVTFTVGPLVEVFREDDARRQLSTALARGLSFAGSPGGGLRQLEGGMASNLFEMSGFSIPSRSQVATGLAVYLVLGFFLPALVFKVLRRREWTFAAVVVASGIATLGIYRYGLLSARKALELEEVTILRLHQDGETAEATSYLGFISPGFRRLDLGPVRATDKHELAQPLRGKLGEAEDSYFSGPLGRAEGGILSIPETRVEVGHGQDLRLSPVTLYPNGMRCLRYDYKLPVGDLFKIVKETDENGQVSKVTFGNLHAVRPLDTLFLHGNAYMFLGLETVLVPSAPGANFRVGSGSVAGSKVLGAVLRVMSGPVRASSGSFLQPRYLVALTHVPIFPVVDEIRVRRAETLIVLELPPQERK